MKQFETVDSEDFEVISCTEECIKCKFQCKTIVTPAKQVNISCRHPKGPGNPAHCIYFKHL